jgi:hypothetical protein
MGREALMSQISAIILLTISLALTGYFGLEAWQVSGGKGDIVGSISP